MAVYFPLVQVVAMKAYQRLRGHAELDDLVGDGCLGLAAAIDAFDPSRGTSFSTYGCRRILGAMIDGVRNRDYLSRGERKRLGDDAPRIRQVSALGGQDMTELYAMPQRNFADPYRAAADRDGFESILKLLPSERDRQIARMLFRDGLTQEQVARRLNLSASRISQRLTVGKGMETSMMAHLREALKDRET